MAARRLTERSKRALEAMEMNAIWPSMRISQKEKIRNEEIKQRMEIESSIMDDIERKQLVWYGHVQRMNGNRVSKVMEWTTKTKEEKTKNNMADGVGR
jgi:hypothetical protein